MRVGLSDDEVKRMQEEAEKHKAEDEQKAEKIKAKNNADAMVATAEKALKDGGDKVPAEIKEKVEEKVKKVKEVSDKDDSTKEDLETATKELSDTLSEIGSAMYGAQGQSAPQGAPGDDATSQTTDDSAKPDDKKKKDDGKVEEGEVVE